MRSATILALAFWTGALVHLVVMPGLAAGDPMSLSLAILLARTFVVGIVFSALMRASAGLIALPLHRAHQAETTE